MRILNAIAIAVIVVGLYFILVGRPPPPSASPVTDGPVVLHIKGGLLEVSTVHATEQFERSTNERLLGLPIGKTVTRIRVPAVYRYHVDLGSDWRVLLKDRTFTVISPPVVPSLPVAIDTAQLQAEASGRWSFVTGTAAHRGPAGVHHRDPGGQGCERQRTSSYSARWHGRP